MLFGLSVQDCPSSLTTSESLGWVHWQGFFLKNHLKWEDALLIWATLSVFRLYKDMEEGNLLCLPVCSPTFWQKLFLHWHYSPLLQDSDVY